MANDIDGDDPSAIYRQAEEVGALLGVLERDLGAVVDAMASPSTALVVRRTAVRRLHRLLQQPLTLTADEAGLPEGPTTGSLGEINRLWHAVDDRSTPVVTRWTGLERPAFARVWTRVGLVMSTLAAVALGAHAYWVALAIVLLRLLGSTVAGGPSISLRGRLSACLAGHFADLVLAVGAAFALNSLGRTGWSQLLLVATSVAIFGSAARIAAERNGFGLSRSPIERLFRNGGLVVALVASGVASGANATAVVPPLAVFAFGLASFGLFELLTVAQAISADDQKPDMTIQLSYRHNGDTWVEALYPVEGETRDEPHLRVVA